MASAISGRVHVDRVHELKLFQDSLGGRGSAHILLIKAEQGMGKSSLLREFLAQAAPFPRALVDLKAGTHTVPRVLAELTTLDVAGFTRFYEQHQQTLTFQFSDNKISRSDLGIDVHVHPGLTDPDQLELRRQTLTRAFFTDLATTNPEGRPRVLIFDTFERASPEVQDWLSGLFLNFARGLRWLVTVIAGREIPEPGVGWDELCIQQTLTRLDRAHVEEWVRRVQLLLSPEETATLYDTSDGIPLDLSIQLGRLLVKRGTSRAGQ